MPRLVPYAVRPDRLQQYVEALTAALDGTGPALLPHDVSAPPPELPGDLGDVPDDLALVVSTSGSTGAPKRAMLTRAALSASAEATHARLGGRGQWLLPMPPQHVAGTQVLLRSIRSGVDPVTLDGPFDPAVLTRAVGRMTGERRYSSVVPTQLRRLLDVPEAVDALRTLDGLLVGGAASAPSLLARARDLGVPVVTTYGMSETCGGCVYDGRPLDGVAVHLDDDGRIGLSGPVVAHGYLSDHERTREAFDSTDEGGRRFWTDDLGELRDGVLQVLGRRDDVITTGGLKVAPRVVEEALLDLPEVAEAVVVATPDDEWGECVSAAVVLRPGSAMAPSTVREALRHRLPAHALPRRWAELAAVPLRGPGKPDRAAVARDAGWQNL